MLKGWFIGWLIVLRNGDLWYIMNVPDKKVLNTVLKLDVRIWSLRGQRSIMLKSNTKTQGNRIYTGRKISASPSCVTVRGGREHGKGKVGARRYALSFLLPPRTGTSVDWLAMCVFLSVNEAGRHLATSIQGSVPLYGTLIFENEHIYVE
jgi:hypothetical protein